ncbi:unnamed protein product [Lactuca saligna]|uniref:FAD-binding FR-type domain-containing protein n=1 Tax=Lactuca saligna TaxID=75948 RepID=A0AA36A292_LACSI|nr:unnamed protein product [Lactuca saligna]
MGTEGSPRDPLLLSIKEDPNGFAYINKTSSLLKSTKWVLKSAMWLIFISWVTFLFLVPSDSVKQLYTKLVKATSGTLFGTTGSIFLIYSGPVLVIAFLAIIYLGISGENEVQEKKTKHASFRLWTFPIIVDGPFGVVTAAELIVILLFSVYLIWAIIAYTFQNISLLPLFEITDAGKRNLILLELTGLRLGFIGLICMAFLFLPVARGSILLRLIDIPFEHAARYHVWLGHLTMILFTLHGLFFVIPWAIDGRLIKELTAWQNVGVANLPGVISLVAGLFIIAAAGIFLFMLDRFLRFFQSRKTVDILSAKCLPSGTVELVISKPEGLQYNALSWVFLQVRELSWLQWHPFSVSSSPLDGKRHIAVLIKVLGDWTEKLRGHISSVPEEEQGETDDLLHPNFTLKASIEGPYGHESPYHLTYEHLILVAGGIGISPFVAIMSDILNRIRDSKPCLPRNVLIVWAVKKSDELPLLHSLDMNSLCPHFYNTLNLEIQTYVTRESEPPLEEGKVPEYVSSSVFPTPTHGGMSTLVGTGSIIWSGAYMVVSTLGFIVLLAMLDMFYINPYKISYWWYKGLLFTICMAASIILFGGFVIGLWHLWDKKTSFEKNKNSEDEKTVGGLQYYESNVHKNSSRRDFVNNIKYGQRPDFKEIFGSMAERWGNVDIGVMVCGPTALQTSIAKECRSKNFGRISGEPIFHFNSHSFDL